MNELLRREGLVRSPAFTHVTVVPGGATVQDLVMLDIVLVDGVDLGAAYPVAAAELAGATPPAVVTRVAGLAVPGALVEVGAVAAVTR